MRRICAAVGAALFIATIVATAGTAQANPLNWLGRSLAIGWSDGYHAHRPPAAYSYWPVEPMPTPAPVHRAAAPHPASEEARPSAGFAPVGIAPRDAYWAR